MTRPVYASGGATSLRTIELTETSGKDITGDPVEVALLPYGTKPLSGSGGTPADLHHPHVNVVQASIEIGPATSPGMYVLWGRIIDTPETDWIKGGLVEVR